MKIELIDDARNFLKFWSVRFGGLATLFSLLEILDALGQSLPILAGTLPPKTFLTLALACSLASILSRVLKQPSLEVPSEKADPDQT